MSSQKGCKFCLRYGLPVLPVRLAITDKEDNLPVLPASMTPLSEAQGETTWTARLLREGYLYIWSELGNRWINYLATSEGYYYPLPENGEVPLDIAEGNVKPCITQPLELASASLITLPVKPAGIKNGVFWLSWSEVEWTDEVRKKHEDASYRSQYMQCFDMDAWINSGNTEQVTAISTLAETVAEYSSKAEASKVKLWSSAPWKRVKPKEGQNLIQAADALYASKGAIIALPDPVAVAQDLSSMLNWRLKTHFADDPNYSRGITLSAALSGLKQAMTEQFRRELIAEDKTNVEMSRTIGTRVIAGVPLPPDDPEGAAAEMERHSEETFDERFKQRAPKRWEDYEKYIDREKEQAFLTKLNVAVEAYNKNVILPMAKMYLSWLQNTSLIHYFLHNFDTANVQSGLCYLQSVTDCLEGMQDQVPVSEWVHNQLAAEAFSGENYILQALVFNNEKVSKLIQEKASKASEVGDLPWENLIDGIKDATEDYSKVFSLKMEYYINTISSGFVRLIEGMVWSKPALALVTMVAASGYGLKVVPLTGKRKHFIRAVLREIALMTDSDGRVSEDKLRPHLDRALRRMGLDGIPLEGTQKRRFLVLIDREELRQMAALPKEAQFKNVGNILRSADDVTDAVFPRFYHNKIAVLRGSTAGQIAGITAGAVPFWGCMASLIFQGIALKVAAGDKELLSWEKGSRFGANVIGAFGSTLELAERALNNLKTLRLKAIVRINMGAGFLKNTLTFLKSWAKYCSRAAIVGIFWDALNAIDAALSGDGGMTIAWGFSFAGGLMLSGLITSIVLGPIGIAWALIFVFGSAIYMAFKGDNDIQKWLKSCQWRKVKKGLYDLPEVYPTQEMEIIAFEEAIQL